MSRLQGTFERLRARGERALIPYFTAGDPSLALTGKLVVEAARQGADIIELGIPFSDPLADGPVIQRATQRALQAGVTLPRVLELVRELRGEVSVPLVFLTYYNPVFASLGLLPDGGGGRGRRDRGRSAAEEPGPLCRGPPAGLDLIHLVAPTPTPARMRKNARASSGFIYMVSLTWVTGERTELPSDLLQHLRALRGITAKPVCVGFGIGNPEQAAMVGRFADGVIVGSAIVRVVEEHAGSPALIPEVGRFIAALKAPLRAT